MAIINFLSDMSVTKSVDQNAGNLTNMYLVPAADNDKYTGAVAYYTPGSTLFSAGTTSLRALFTEHGITYGVDGNTFFSVNSSGTRTSLGILNTSSGWCKIRGNVGELLIVDLSNGYSYIIASTTFAKITDINFPTAIQDIECQDEWGIVVNQNSQTFQTSAISDVTTWPALQFASVTGNQNQLVSVTSVHRELYFMSTQTGEVWDNTGTVPETFTRNESAYIEWGCAGVGTVVKGNNTMYFLAQSPTGGWSVMAMSGYTPQAISSLPVNYAISLQSANISSLYAFVYQQEGHEFYCLAVPGVATYCLDLTTNLWHTRQSLISGSQTNWFPTCMTYNYGKVLVGDPAGNIQYLDMTNYTENGVAITRTLQTHPYYNAGAYSRVGKLQIDFDTSPGTTELATWNLAISRDGGHTFPTNRLANVQTDANGAIRVYWERIGGARIFAFQLSTNANMKCIILGAWANVALGQSN